jgi:hypothetical protein
MVDLSHLIGDTAPSDNPIGLAELFKFGRFDSAFGI